MKTINTIPSPNEVAKVDPIIERMNTMFGEKIAATINVTLEKPAYSKYSKNERLISWVLDKIKDDLLQEKEEGGKKITPPALAQIVDDRMADAISNIKDFEEVTEKPEEKIQEIEEREEEGSKIIEIVKSKIKDEKWTGKGSEDMQIRNAILSAFKGLIKEQPVVLTMKNEKIEKMIDDSIKNVRGLGVVAKADVESEVIAAFMDNM